MEFETLEKM